MTETDVRNEWNNSAAIRAEFRGNFAGYSAFRQAEMRGRVKFSGNKCSVQVQPEGRSNLSAQPSHAQPSHAQTSHAQPRHGAAPIGGPGFPGDPFPGMRIEEMSAEQILRSNQAYWDHRQSTCAFPDFYARVVTRPS